jgi:hypothetical protein
MAVEPRGRFLDRLIKETHLKEWTKENEQALGARMMRLWFGEESPEDRTPLRSLTPSEGMLVEIFRDYGEIFHTISRLEMAAQFLKKLQPHRADADVIGYHIEKCLEETYIARERIGAFLKRLQRRARKLKLHQEVLKLEAVEDVALKAFDGVCRTRGMHVHEGRFEDEDVKRVASLDLLVKSGDMKKLEPLRRIHARVVLIKWRKTANDNIESIKTLVNSVIEVAEPIVFEKLVPSAR